MSCRNITYIDGDANMTCMIFRVYPGLKSMSANFCRHGMLIVQGNRRYVVNDDSREDATNMSSPIWVYHTSPYCLI